LIQSITLYCAFWETGGGGVAGIRTRNAAYHEKGSYRKERLCGGIRGYGRKKARKSGRTNPTRGEHKKDRGSQRKTKEALVQVKDNLVGGGQR